VKARVLIRYFPGPPWLCLGLCFPRVVCTDAPEVAFEVATGEGAATVVHIADVEDHLGAGGFGGGVDGVGVGGDEVDPFGLAEADLVGLNHEFGGFASVVNGTEHDHAVAEGELGVHDGGVVGGEVDGLLFEAEGADEPVDGGERVAVTKAGDDGGAAGFGLVGHLVGHVVKDASGVWVASWKNRRGYPPPPWGYFGRKFIVFNGLNGTCVCKIVITNGLPAKYLLSIS
jgi:hypothetical protein